MNEPNIFHEYDPNDDSVGDALQTASDAETADGRLLGRTATGIGREFEIERILAQILGGVPFALRTAYRKGTLVYSSGDLYAVTATIEDSNTQTLAQLLAAGTLVKVVDVEGKVANWAEMGNTSRIPVGKIPTSLPRALRTAAATARLLETLTEATRLSYTALKDTPPTINILVPASMNRKDKIQVLPAEYTTYNTLRITTFSNRGNQEVTQDIATALLSAIATLTNYGASANHSFSWVRSTRTITYTPSQSASNSGIIYCDLHS